MSSLRQLVKLSPRPTLTLRRRVLMCRPCPSLQQQSRQLSLSYCRPTQKLISADNIISSPTPEITVPDQAFHHLLFDRCEQFKDNTALEEYLTGKSCTYKELKEMSINVASNLHQMGFRKGDIVLVFSTNCIDFTILFLACSMLGVWFSPANPTFTTGELSNQLRHGRASSVFVHSSLSDTMTAALAECTDVEVKHKFSFGEVDGYKTFQSLLEENSSVLPDVAFNPAEDILALPYSSGTTGLPKGVMLTHRNCVANVLQTSNSVPVKETDVAIGLLPLYHIYGMIVVQFGVLDRGGCVVFLPKFEPVSFLSCVQDKKVTMAHLVPPLVLFLARHPVVSDYDLSSLRKVVCGAAPLSADTSEEFCKRHDYVNYFTQGYGLTETSPVTNIDLTQTFGCTGNFVCNTEGKIVDFETGRVLGMGEEGELYIRGPQIMKGYYKNQKATDEMISEDGWLATGDIGIFDEQGRIFIKDRLKELIKYKGSQVAPAELEAVVLTHPAVLDAAVIGMPDEEAGELPRAFVVKKAGVEVTEDEIVQFVDGLVAKAKRLRGGVQFISEVPKNPSGKILRRILRSKYCS